MRTIIAFTALILGWGSPALHAMASRPKEPAAGHPVPQASEAARPVTPNPADSLWPDPPPALLRVEIFEDIKRHPQQRFVNELAERGVIPRDSPRFEPEKPVTPRDFSAWAETLFGRKPALDTAPAGIPTRQALEAIEALSGRGWTTWLPEPQDPGEQLTRAGAAELLVRAFQDPVRHAAPLTTGTLYVSTHGNDSWTGKLPEPNSDGTDGPLATPQASRDRLRSLRQSGLSGDANILFRAGTYPFVQTLELGPEDGGLSNEGTTYRNYGDEPVVFSGGLRLAEWEKIEDREDSILWRSKLPAGLPPVRLLVAGEQVLPRARFPETGYARILSVDNAGFPKRFQLDRPLPAGRSLSPHAEMIDLSFWTSRRERVAASGADWVEGVTHLGMAPWHLLVANAGNACFLENDPLFLTQPWHWCLNESGDALLLLLPKDRDPNELRIVAPVLERLVRVAGTDARPVRNVRFQGIAFAHTAATLPAQGISELQATFFNDRLSEKDIPGRLDRVYSLPPAIEVTYARGIEFFDVRLAQLGNQGINFGEGSRYCQMSGSEVHDIGGTGILVGAREVWGDGAAATDIQDGRGDWRQASQVPYGITISDNRIHDCGQIVFGGVGIWAGYTKFTTLARNEVHHLPYSGISLGWSFFSKLTSMEYPLIELNHVHDVMRVLTDGGGIYVLGYQPGGVMRGNVVHESWRNTSISGFFAHGLYLDEGSRFWLIEGNSVFDNFHDLKLNNYLRNERYENVDFDGNILANKRRVGGRDWLTFRDNRFGKAPDRHGAGPLAMFRARLDQPSPVRSTEPLFPQPVITYQRIIGEKQIANPGFEQADMSGWRLLEGWATGGVIQRVEDPGAAASGRAFLRFSRGRYTDPFLSNAIALEEGKTYRLQATIRLGAGAPAKFRIYLESLGREVVSDLPLVPGEWVKIDRTFTMDETISSYLVFQSLDPASGITAIDLDDVSVTEVPR